MKFDVFQINFTDEQENLINSSKERPDFFIDYLDTTFRPTADAVIKAKNQYKKVASIEANDFEDVFEIGNIGPESKITRITRMHSVSVGDVIVREDGVAKFVAPIGFESVVF